MNKELYELLMKMKSELLNNQGITLSKKELSLLLKYINELELEISGGID